MRDEQSHAWVKLVQLQELARRLKLQSKTIESNMQKNIFSLDVVHLSSRQHITPIFHVSLRKHAHAMYSNISRL